MQTKTHKRTEYALRKLSRNRWGSHRWRENADRIHADYHGSALPHATKRPRLRNIVPIPGFSNWQLIETPRIFAVRAKRGSARNANPAEKRAWLFFDVIRGVSKQLSPRDLRLIHGVIYSDGFLVVSKKSRDSVLWRIAYAWVSRFRLFMQSTPPTEVKAIVERCQFIYQEYSTRKPNTLPPRMGGFTVESLRRAAMLVKLNY